VRTRLTLAFLFSAAAFAQTFDTSNNAALKGDYFIREVLIAGQSSAGAITSAKSAIGLITFDGKGGYVFNGAGVTANGSYGLAANGLLYIQSIADNTQNAFGGLSAVGPTAFVASATEGTSADLIVAIPAAAGANNASLKGSYTGGYIAFPGGADAMVRQASFSFASDGAGNLSSFAVTGAALDLGGKTVSQSISGATYTLSGEGSGGATFGAASSSQVLSGPMNLYVSADGNLFMAGTPGGTDLVVGMKSLSSAASNATWSNLYFTGAMEDQVKNGATPTHNIDAFYGSWNSNGAGISIMHDRFQTLQPPQQVFDYTFDCSWTVLANGTATPAGAPYNIALGAGGQAFIGTGTNGLYSLIVGFASQRYTGSGVYLNPLGVVNAASFAPVTNPIAPGELIALFGSGLASSTVSAPSLPLPTMLGNVQVTINGHPAPLVYVTPTQIVAQVPRAITPANQIANATIQVINNSVKSNSVTVYTNYTSPGVFAYGGNGVGFAAAQRPDYSVITAANPAKVGETIVLYASGLGGTNPAVNDGVAAPSTVPLAKTIDADVVVLSGQQANVVFNGLTPGLAGLYQLNSTIVQGTPFGTGLADISTPDGYTSQTNIAVTSGASSMARTPAMLDRPHARRQGIPERARSQQ
jgi:uncharacterized protein (TIGR03437 family)